MRVRHDVAKSRHSGSPDFVVSFIFPHSSAQARIFSREARGSDGGGTDVSTGASVGAGAGVPASGRAGGFGAGADGFTAFVVADGFAAVRAGAGLFGPVARAGSVGSTVAAYSSSAQSARPTAPRRALLFRDIRRALPFVLRRNNSIPSARASSSLAAIDKEAR